MPGGARGSVKETPTGVDHRGPNDPRKVAVPKPAPAAGGKVKLVPAEERGKEPWMDDVSVLDGLGGDQHPDDSGQDEKRGRKREVSRGKISSGGKHLPPGGEGNRGDFFGGDKKKEKTRKRKKDKDRKRRRKSSSSSSTKSGGDGSSEGSLYGRDRHRHTPLAEKAKKRPGRLLKSGLEEVAKYLARRLGEGSCDVGSSWRQQRVGAYVSQVLMVQHSADKMGQGMQEKSKPLVWP